MNLRNDFICYLHQQTCTDWVDEVLMLTVALTKMAPELQIYTYSCGDTSFTIQDAFFDRRVVRFGSVIMQPSPIAFHGRHIVDHDPLDRQLFGRNLLLDAAECFKQSAVLEGLNLLTVLRFHKPLAGLIGVGIYPWRRTSFGMTPSARSFWNLCKTMMPIRHISWE